MEKKAYFEIMEKYYTYDELVDRFNKKNIISLKDIKQKISKEKLEESMIENEIDIKLFKSYYYDKYIVLSGAKYLLGLYRLRKEDFEYKYFAKNEINTEFELGKLESINKFNISKKIKINVIYSNLEKEEPKNFYKRLNKIFGVPVTNFLKKRRNDINNG